MPITKKDDAFCIVLFSVFLLVYAPALTPRRSYTDEIGLYSQMEMHISTMLWLSLIHI